MNCPIHDGAKSRYPIPSCSCPEPPMNPCDMCGMAGQIDLCNEKGEVSTTACYRCWGSGWMRERTISFENTSRDAMEKAVEAIQQEKK